MKVVDKYSSRLGLHESETIISIDSTHANMVKFAHQACPNYNLVLEQIKYIAESASNYSTIESKTVCSNPKHSHSTLARVQHFDMLL